MKWSSTQGALPYIFSPDLDTSLSNLLTVIAHNKTAIVEQWQKSGAVLFKGFDVKTASDFEQVCAALEPDLKNDYLGTSPRNKLTDFVFTASELPPHYPIMQHCEMSFLPNAPRRLFFFCETAPKQGGETPLCDFAKVWEHLDPAVKEAFRKKGIRNIRNYSSPFSPQKSSPWQLKPWTELFLTDDPQKVEDISKPLGLEVVWTAEKGLRLINTQPAFKTHPQLGIEVWFNHLQVFHKDAAVLEYQHIAKRQGSLRSWYYAFLLKWLTRIKNNRIKPEEQAMHIQYADGSEIPHTHLVHVIDTIWQFLQFPKWEQGDVLMIDNFRVAHGRMPYAGPRSILVAWSS